MLYKDYKPKNFSEMLGDAPKLVQAIASRKRTGFNVHALLFYGQKGTGKTASAQILAKALNCENYEESVGPCCVCNGCRMSEREPILNQFDAAAMSGAEAAREATSAMRSIPSGRHVTFIFDEAHNMSDKAKDVLLLPIENPRDHLTIILCTTEPQAIKDTIFSRCARVAFHAIPADQLGALARRVLAEQAPGLPYTAEDIDRLVTLSGGSPRDLLSLLETPIAVGSMSAALSNLGTPAAEDLYHMLKRGSLSEAANLVRDRRNEFANPISQLTEVFGRLVEDSVSDPIASRGTDALMDGLIKAGRSGNKGLASWLVHYSLRRAASN